MIFTFACTINLLREMREDMIKVREVLQDFVSLAESEIERRRGSRFLDGLAQWEATVRQAKELLAMHKEIIDVEDILA